MVREQFTNSCPKDVSMFLKERSPKDLEELAKLAEQYLNAHGKKLSTKAPVTKQDVKTRGVITGCSLSGLRARKLLGKKFFLANELFGITGFSELANSLGK